MEDNRQDREIEEKTDGELRESSYNSLAYEGYGWFIRTRNIVYYILGVIEVLLFFRLMFKLLGANPGNGFVAFLYSLTGKIALPFYGIFRTVITGGTFPAFAFEPSTVIAMIVYAIIAWGIVKLLKIKISGGI